MEKYLSLQHIGKRYAWTFFIMVFSLAMVQAQNRPRTIAPIPPAMKDDGVKLTIVDGISNPLVKNAIETNVSKLLTTINKAQEQRTEPFFPYFGIKEEAQKDIQMLWKNETFKCKEASISRSGLTTPQGYQVRGIPLTLFPRDGSEQLLQEAVIGLDRQGNITSFNYTINPEMYSTLVQSHLSDKRNEVIDISQRQTIIGYVEQFRTAYNKKDLEFMNQIFSEDALIITGTVITPKKSDVPLPEKGKWYETIYKVMTKSEYLTSLEKKFKTPGYYINVEFDSIRIAKHSMGNVYGVTVRQKWYSRNSRGREYSDDGYVFMVWDFRNEYPEIRVRTWQPYWLDQSSGVRLDPDDIFSFRDFDF